jgi:hypothetical protein
MTDIGTLGGDSFGLAVNQSNDVADDQCSPQATPLRSSTPAERSWSDSEDV